MATDSAVRAGRLGRGHAAMLSRLLDGDPVLNVYLRSELRAGVEAGDWWGILGADGLRAATLGGALVVPCIPRLEDAEPLAGLLLSACAPRLLVGPRAAVLALHSALGRPARDVRDPQHLMAVDSRDYVAQEPSPVRRATGRDVDALVIAAAEMHREEMGIDPLAIDAAGWRSRMATLIDRGWSWVWTDGGRVVFKAELSAWTPEVVQIQGVWTDPSRRSQGVARRGLAGVCQGLLRDVPLCSLYVNHYNDVAIRLYKRLGFTKVADFATVIY
ncbi:MAG: GNAT family N-acetyltransferase [Candidatus Dormibacteraeota bacterium]|nr:GNAT family N-acetyltransferase [Candidatus Dormibacteraeota bacterium]